MSLYATSIGVDFQAVMRKALDVVGNQDVTIKPDPYRKTLATGTGAGLADILYHVRSTGLAKDGSESYDLSAALEDIWGDAAVFVKAKGILIINRSNAEGAGTAAIIGVDGNWITSTFGASTDIPIESGSCWLWLAQTAGVAVTNDSADTITVTNNSGTELAAAYDIFVIGTSA